jgi:HlyD family secretion protein
MLKGDSTFNMLIVAAILALGVGYYVPQTFSSRPAELGKAAGDAGKSTTASTPKADPAPKAAAKATWAASAPGRVEPLGGEVRIGASGPGRIAEVLASANDTVMAGDLVIRLEDDELIARAHSVVADVAVRKRDRDTTEAVGRQAQDRRSAEDAVANAERQIVQHRDELDRALRAKRTGSDASADVTKLRDALTKARERLDQARATLRKALAADGLPAPTRPEAALAAARAELSVADAALERTRIRAPSNGVLLQINAKVGETVAPSPENPLMVIGDLSSLRVKAEFEERDIGKVRVGQAAVVRSDAFPGKEFEGRVATIARSLGPSRLGQRGPRRPTDVDVLEVLIDLAGQPPLMPGMRVDVFLKADPVAQPASNAKRAEAGKAN